MPVFQTVLQVGFLLWVVAGAGGLLGFRLSKNARFKLKWFPLYVVVVHASFFLLFATASARSSPPLEAVVEIVVTACILAFFARQTMRHTTFCQNCGHMLVRRLMSGKINYCPRCGTAIIRPGDDSQPSSGE